MTALPVSIPVTLAARPRDPRRGLPIPAVNEFPTLGGDGFDFTVINSLRGLQLAQARCCSLCAHPMPPKIAFLGGPRTADNAQYSDPPACPPCMTAALTLCPHIRIPHAKRATRTKVQSSEIPGYTGTRPDTWHMVIARNLRIVLVPVDGGRDQVPLYVPVDVVRTVTYGYDRHGTLAALDGP